MIYQADPKAVCVVAPSDHLITNEMEFCRIIRQAFTFAGSYDHLVTLGIKPTRPDTGYGYIQYNTIPSAEGFHEVKTFTEKPTVELAQTFIESGEFLWNAGIFAWKPRAVLDALAAHKPALRDGVMRIAEAWDTPQRDSVMANIFPTLEKVSIDYALLEKHDEVVVLGAPFQWDDVGSWLAQVTEIEWFNTRGESVTMVTGLIFVVCVLAFRRGIIGELAARMR
jgi:mannose-1-phosphate guanylyltransferase